MNCILGTSSKKPTSDIVQSNQNDAKATTSQDCQVCLQRAHGIHFGVMSCRACAAFFRRSVVTSRVYICRRSSSSCDVIKGERFLCRSCRLAKCRRLGMTDESGSFEFGARISVSWSDHVQWNRDPVADSNCNQEKNIIAEKPEEQQEPCSSTKPIKEPPTILRPIPVPATSRHYKYEMELLMHKAQMAQHIRTLMSEFSADTIIPSSSQMSLLERMHAALIWCRRTQKNTVKVVYEMDRAMGKEFMEKGITRCAEWFMFSPEFCQLTQNDKMAIYRDSWSQWNGMERLLVSIQIMGSDFLKTRLIVLTDDSAATLEELKLDMTIMSDHDPEYVRSLIYPTAQRIFNEVATPMMEMKLSYQEETYILCQLAFHTEGRSLSDEAHKACIEFRNRISADLHEYYTNVVQQPNYANRLIKILDLVHTMERIRSAKAKVMELARIFDVIKISIDAEQYI